MIISTAQRSRINCLHVISSSHLASVYKFGDGPGADEIGARVFGYTQKMGRKSSMRCRRVGKRARHANPRMPPPSPSKHAKLTRNFGGIYATNLPRNCIAVAEMVASGIDALFFPRWSTAVEVR